ncbi:MAG: hypothetical protein Q9214_000518 [Letrouitia sp. 1 TL-2023]
MALQPFALFLAFSLLFLWRACSANQPGIVGLWSDSECNSKGETSHFGQPDPIDLNFSLEPDICGVPGATVHSYRVKQLAVCDNGTQPIFTIYHRDNCTGDPTDEDQDPNPTVAKRRIEVEERQFTDTDGNSLVGSCLALVEFNSLAFVCDRVDPDMGRAKVASTLRSTSTFVTGVTSTLRSASTFVTGAATRTATGTAVDTEAQATRSQVTGEPFVVVSPFASRSGSVRSSPMATPPTTPPATPLLQQKSSSSPRLSTGASAGVGIGCAAGLLVVAAAAFLLFRRYRIVRRADERSTETSGASENVPPALESGQREKDKAPAIYA